MQTSAAPNLPAAQSTQSVRSLCLALELASPEGDLQKIADRTRSLLPALAAEHNGVTGNCYLSAVRQAIEQTVASGELESPRGVSLNNVAGKLLSCVSGVVFRGLHDLRREVELTLSQGLLEKRSPILQQSSDEFKSMATPRNNAHASRSARAAPLTSSNIGEARSESNSVGTSPKRQSNPVIDEAAEIALPEADSSQGIPRTQELVSPEPPVHADDAEVRSNAMAVLHEKGSNVRAVLRASFQFLTNSQTVSVQRKLSPASRELVDAMSDLKQVIPENEHVTSMFCDEVTFLLKRLANDSNDVAAFEALLLQRVKGFAELK